MSGNQEQTPRHCQDGLQVLNRRVQQGPHEAGDSGSAERCRARGPMAPVSEPESGECCGHHQCQGRIVEGFGLSEQAERTGKQQEKNRQSEAVNQAKE